MNRPQLLVLTALLLAAHGTAHADVAAVAGPAGSALDARAESMLRREVQDAVARVIEAGAFGDIAAEQIALSVAVPAERVVNVGLLVDSRSTAENGLPVLGTLAGGDAQRLGLRAGDVLTSINGVSLVALGSADDGTALAVARVRAAVESLDDGGRLAVTVLRQGRKLELAGDVTPRYIPAMRLELGDGMLVASNAPAAAARRVASTVTSATGSGCGRISVFHVAPRSQDLYPAKILAIDGEIPGTAHQDTYRVAPGPHEVEVAEQIDDQDLPGTYARARRHKSKVFTIEVRPHTTYLVASQLNDGREREVIRNGYWDPVVWKEIDERCR